MSCEALWRLVIVGIAGVGTASEGNFAAAAIKENFLFSDLGCRFPFPAYELDPLCHNLAVSDVDCSRI
ncbi:hypothetical protein SUGI_0601630 [Cryptomeria japonica]|nr:hypothetical protein SUGI_0601630 [Cryptomeria japonica]